MKTATTVLALLTISCAAALAPANAPKEFIMKTAANLKKTLGDLGSYLESIENSVVPLVNVPAVPGHQLKLSTLQLTNIKVQGISNVEVTKLIASYKFQYIKTLVKVPLITLNGNYKLEGSYAGESIKGEGTFEFKLIDILIRLKGSFALVNFKPKMTGIEFGHVIGHVQLRATGMNGDTDVYKRFDQIGADYILVALHNYYSSIEAKLSARLLMVGNTIASGNGDLEAQAEALGDFFLPSNESEQSESEDGEEEE